MKNNNRLIFDMALCMLVLPVLGIVWAGWPVWRYLEFPPVTQYVRHADFSWPVFIVMAVGVMMAVFPFEWRVFRSIRNTEKRTSSVRAFPWWGWIGIFLGAGSWTLAWNRFEWFALFQIFIFTPLWLAYVITVNAFTYKRTGHCMIIDRPRFLAELFVASAVFWWFFEYLNRFVQNWYYEGIEGLGGLKYFLMATLPFSTVLPAVMGTYELLASYPGAGAGLDDFLKIPIRRPVAAAWLGLLLSLLVFLCLGIWPDYMFPFLWIAPLVTITSIQRITGRETIWAGTGRGRWRDLYLFAVSALVCGVFWELWNFHSYAKWKYSVPFVDAFRIFEMPVLGFAGYLPFGLECAVIAGLVAGRKTDGVNSGEVVHVDYPVARIANIIRHINTLIVIVIAAHFFIIPGILSWNNLADPKMRNGEIPEMAWRLHRRITPGYADWARDRVTSGKAANLVLHDVPSTEWPMFGSVYYLWATENLQRAWEADNNLSREAPAVYARDTIEAAMDLVLDPVHHTWVRQHWGTGYMHTQNVFFRSMIMAAVISHENLLGTGKHLELLHDQADSLARELDASPHGVLEDYPRECYPVDVFMAVAMIQRADKLLGTDHGAFVKRSIRAFEGSMLDERGLVPYFVDARTGRHLGTSRGVGNSYILIFARELWPDLAKQWYDNYEKYFWDDRSWVSGFREYPRELAYLDYSFDVDAGPIIAGFSPAANAFGVAAARINGRLDHACTLSSQVVISCWPLATGRLFGPMLLSSWEHAPYLGEACILYFLSQRPAQGVQRVTGGFMPATIYIGSAFYFGCGLLIILLTLFSLRRWRRKKNTVKVPVEYLQVFLWLAAFAVLIAMTVLDNFGPAVLAYIILQSVPFCISAKGLESC